jgi:hypothetical protein
MSKKNHNKNRRKHAGGKRKANPAPKPDSAGALPAVPEVNKHESGETNRAAGKNAHYEPKRIDRFVFWNLIVAIVIMCATAAQAWIGGCQWNVMNRGLNQADETLALMRLQTPQSMVRPKEVLIEEIDVPANIREVDATKRFKITAILENVGDIPATITGCDLNIYDIDKTNTPAAKAALSGELPRSYNTEIILSPKDTWPAFIIYGTGYTEDDLEEIRLGKRPGFGLVIIVYYRDVSSDTRQSRFLYAYSATTGMMHQQLKGNYVIEADK